MPPCRSPQGNRSAVPLPRRDRLPRRRESVPPATGSFFLRGIRQATEPAPPPPRRGLFLYSLPTPPMTPHRRAADSRSQIPLPFPKKAEARDRATGAVRSDTAHPASEKHRQSCARSPHSAPGQAEARSPTGTARVPAHTAHRRCRKPFPHSCKTRGTPQNPHRPQSRRTQAATPSEHPALYTPRCLSKPYLLSLLYFLILSPKTERHMGRSLQCYILDMVCTL